MVDYNQMARESFVVSKAEFDHNSEGESFDELFFKNLVRLTANECILAIQRGVDMNTINDFRQGQMQAIHNIARKFDIAL